MILLNAIDFWIIVLWIEKLLFWLWKDFTSRYQTPPLSPAELSICIIDKIINIFSYWNRIHCLQNIRTQTYKHNPLRLIFLLDYSCKYCFWWIHYKKQWQNWTILHCYYKYCPKKCYWRVANDLNLFSYCKNSAPHLIETQSCFEIYSLLLRYLFDNSLLYE